MEGEGGSKEESEGEAWCVERVEDVEEEGGRRTGKGKRERGRGTRAEQTLERTGKRAEQARQESREERTRAKEESRDDREGQQSAGKARSLRRSSACL